MNDFYTYAYLREDESPYYVGKGRGNRAFSTHKRIARPKDISRIMFLREGMSEKESFEHEIEMIKTWGRKDLGAGMLRNMSDGGEGSSGAKRSDKTKSKMSLALIGRKRAEETKAKIGLGHLGFRHTEETKAKIRMSNLGKKMSYESRAKMSLAGKNNWIKKKNEGLNVDENDIQVRSIPPILALKSFL